MPSSLQDIAAAVFVKIMQRGRRVFRAINVDITATKLRYDFTARTSPEREYNPVENGFITRKRPSVPQTFALEYKGALQYSFLSMYPTPPYRTGMVDSDCWGKIEWGCLQLGSNAKVNSPDPGRLKNRQESSNRKRPM